MSTTPEALRIAGQLTPPVLPGWVMTVPPPWNPTRETCSAAAAELRRQHAEIERLRAALKEVGVFLHHCWCDVQMNDHSFQRLNAAMESVDAMLAPARAEIVAALAQKGE